MNEFFRAAAEAGKRTNKEAIAQAGLSFEIEYAEPVDVAAERARLERLFGGSGFDLFPALPGESDLLVLQFSGQPANQSAEYLFALSQELADAIGATAVVPNTAPQRRGRSEDAFTEGMPDFIWRLCTVDTEPPDDPQWARKLIMVPAVEARGITGAGIRVAQPDTGVADHDELITGLDKTAGYDTLADRPDPTDPLSEDMGTPGHGTATSSAVISRADGVVVGSAVGASVVPIRCIDDVIIGAGTSVARAIRHAISVRCHVITMSLGGVIPGRALRRALRDAVDNHLIVMAAAGNCVGLVVFPAWDDNVIAVAGVDHEMNKWIGSSSGEDVDVSAPGQHVTVARRAAVPAGQSPLPDALKDVTREGQGTSFAVALTAGVAALWMEHMGVEAVRAEAERRGTTVQMLFREALRITAGRPDGWDASEMGAGVVNADALVGLPLAEIPSTPAPGASGPAIGFFGLESPLPPRFDAEANFLAFDRLARRDMASATTLESPTAPRPSPALEDYLGPRRDTLAAPAVVPSPATPPVPVEVALRRLSTARTGPLEDVPRGDTAGVTQAIRRTGTDAIMSQAQEKLEGRAKQSAKADRAVQKQALNAMAKRLEAVTNEPPSHVPSPVARAQLEALVRLIDRPALRMTDDDAVIRDPEIGEWAAKLIPTFGRWSPLVRAVGRIDVRDRDLRWRHTGTGIVCADGQVLTNRHVLDFFAEPLPSRAQRFTIRREASIVFDNEPADDANRFAITEVLAAGQHRIGATADLAKLDAALVSIETNNGSADHPLPIGIGALGAVDGSDVLVAGYPAEPDFASGPASHDPEFVSFWTRIGEIFGDDYSVKYVSPGLVMDGPGGLGGDLRGWAYSHDATTLGGNSGSVILALQPDMKVAGLHFGGSALSLNLAHDLIAVGNTDEGAFVRDLFRAGTV